MVMKYGVHDKSTSPDIHAISLDDTENMSK